jgi:hypothetical protein
MPPTVFHFTIGCLDTKQPPIHLEQKKSSSPAALTWSGKQQTIVGIFLLLYIDRISLWCCLGRSLPPFSIFCFFIPVVWFDSRSVFLVVNRQTEPSLTHLGQKQRDNNDYFCCDPTIHPTATRAFPRTFYVHSTYKNLYHGHDRL